MIKEKIKNEMSIQGINQAELLRRVSKLGKEKTLTKAQLSNYLSGKKLLSMPHIESIFEVLDVDVVRILKQ